MGLTENGGGSVLRIRRATRDRWIMGVCGGIAHTYGWNSNVVRLLTAVLAIIIPGFSLIPVILIYILLGVILEESQEY
ncbi:MAG: PspC domain-containing protein [Rubrobacteraceae bacterium]|nr:PspC domain-containing protein [Rubrobacteraceae bacterium]